MENLKHYFASANTGKKFYNLFAYINNDSEKGMLYIIKGGSGTGKSTLMKKIGQHFLEKGEEIEYFHCSSDYKSLDGVRLKKHNIAIIDGTSPHAAETILPGIKEKLVNVGQYIGEGVAEFENEIRHHMEEKSRLYKSAYSIIEAAAKLYECNYNIYKNITLETEIVEQSENILKKLNLKKQTDKPYMRKLFLTAIAENGILTFEKENNYENTLTVKGNSYFISKTLEKINEVLNSSGYSTICFYETLEPLNISSVYIEDIDTFFSSKEVLTKTEDKEISEILKFNTKEIKNLRKQAAKILALAKKEHSKIEKYYISSMNFKGLDTLTEELLEEIENRIAVKSE